MSPGVVIKRQLGWMQSASISKSDIWGSCTQRLVWNWFSGVSALWNSYLSFGSGDDLLIRILVQVDGLALLHTLLNPWTSVQKSGPAPQRGACGHIRSKMICPLSVNWREYCLIYHQGDIYRQCCRLSAFVARLQSFLTPLATFLQ